MSDPTSRRENLVRAMAPGALTVDGDGKSLFGHFARFNEWNLIDSVMEGRFLERIAPGAFTKTLRERTPKILFNHGKDPVIGDKVIAASRSFGEDEIGPTLDGELLDGLDPLLVSGLRAGQYGMSYRFSIPSGKDVWVRNAKPSDYNPEGIPERTIREAMVFEAGPVTWPADPGTNAGVRSMTDDYTLDTLTADPERLAALIEAKQGKALDAPEPVTATPVARAADPVVTPPIATPVVSRKDTPEVSDQYVTREDKIARAAELKDAIERQATSFPGVMPEDEQVRWDADNEELDALERDLAALDARIARVASLKGDPKRTEYATPTIVRAKTHEDIYSTDQFSGIGFRSVEERTQKIRENALRSLESSRVQNDELANLIANDDVNKRGLPSLAERMLKTGSPAYKRAFTKYVQSGNEHGLTAEERAAVAVVGTTTTGGYAVPYIFDPSIVRVGAYTATNPFRAACKTVTITSGNNWKGVTVGAVTAAYAAEAATASENGPTWGTLDYTVRRAQAFVTLSIEALEDRSDFTDELTGVFGEAKDTLEENKFAIGDGNAPTPMGMFTDTAFTNVDTATNDVTAIADLQLLEAALPLRFRKNGAFFMNRSTIRQLQALDTTYRYFSGSNIQFSGGAGFLAPGSSSGGNTGLQLLGYPLWEVPSAVSTLTTDGAIIVIFCDPAFYQIVDRIGMNVEVIQNMSSGATPNFPTGQRGVYAYWRNTAKPIAADAGRSLSVQ